MRLSAGDIAALPFSCALVDPSGRVAASSPEWRGPALGSLTYRLGEDRLVVVPDGSNHDVDGLVKDLVAAVTQAAAGMGVRDRMAAEMYAAGLALVAGRGLSPDPAGTTSRAVEYCQEGVRRSGVRLALDVEFGPDGPVEAPAAVGLALVQLVRNAARHAGVESATLRVLPGPTFRVEWRARARAAVATARRPDQRARWGMGYARLLADALGGVVTAPAAVGDGIVASTLGLGAERLGAPVASVVGGRVERATRAWDEETGWPPGTVAAPRLAAAVEAAKGRPGQIAYADIFRARQAGRRMWVAISPQSSLGRARDVLRGMQHENALLTATEPLATRVYALATILTAAVGGDPIDAVSGSVWQRDFPAACAAMGVRPAPTIAGGRLRYPDPRVTAYVLGALGGAIEEGAAEGAAADPRLYIRVPGSHQDDPLVRTLGGGKGLVALPA